MKAPGSMPPLSNSVKDSQWILGVVLLLVGCIVHGFAMSGMFQAMGFIGGSDSHQGLLRYNTWGRLFDYSHLALLPLALISDYFLDRRDSLFLGPLLMALGFLAILSESRWLFLTSVSLVMAGSGLTFLSLLGYLGTRWKGNRLQKYGGYLLAFAGSSLGGICSEVIIGSRWEMPNPYNFFWVGLVVCLLIMMVFIWARSKEVVFPGEKMPGEWITWRSLGMSLIFVFFMITAGAFFVLDEIDWSGNKESRYLYLGGLAMLAFALVMLFSASHFPLRSKISLAMVFGAGFMAWYVYSNSTDLMLSALHLGYVGDGEVLTGGVLANLGKIVGSGGLAVVWLLRMKKKGGNTIPMIGLMGGLFLLVLMPYSLASGDDGSYVGKGWLSIIGFLYHAAFAITIGSLFFLTWLFTPVRLKATGFAILLSGFFFMGELYRMEHWIFGPHGIQSELKLNDFPFWGFLGFLLAGGLLLFHLRIPEE